MWNRLPARLDLALSREGKPLSGATVRWWRSKAQEGLLDGRTPGVAAGRAPDGEAATDAAGKASIGGETGYMLAGVLTCGEAAFSVMHTKGDMTTPDPAELQRVKCPTTRIDPATLPTVQSRFGKACDGGDAIACEVLAMLVDEEPKLLADQDAKKLRARACELGAKHLCAGG